MSFLYCLHLVSIFLHTNKSLLFFPSEYRERGGHYLTKRVEELQQAWEPIPNKNLPIWLYILKQLDGPLEAGQERCLIWRNEIGTGNFG